jgi:transposase
MQCLNEGCPRQTFSEVMPDFIPSHAQRTLRQTQWLRGLVFEINASAAARICDHLRIRASTDTLTRMMRRTEFPSLADPRMIGIDDWAKRKGVAYGTLIIDLERHCPIAVLPNRTADSMKAWLLEHSSLQIVCRDRYSEYIDAIQQGAPTALQIIDRWHLLKNLSDTLHRMLSAYGQELQVVANRLASEKSEGMQFQNARLQPDPSPEIPN